jgi:hypothetical protein
VFVNSCTDGICTVVATLQQLLPLLLLLLLLTPPRLLPAAHVCCQPHTDGVSLLVATRVSLLVIAHHSAIA